MSFPKFLNASLSLFLLGPCFFHQAQAGDDSILDQKTSSLWYENQQEKEIRIINDNSKVKQDYSPEYNSYKERLLNIWHAPNKFYILPVNTYHSRNTYSKERIAEYNEKPWGFGFGKWYKDKNDTKHQLALLGFSDSNYKPQLVFSYTWQRDLYINEAHDLLFGYGCDFFLTSRDESFYIPFPGFTPQVSIQYKNMAFTTSWVPWLGNNYGNILLTTVRWYF